MEKEAEKQMEQKVKAELTGLNSELAAQEEALKEHEVALARLGFENEDEDENEDENHDAARGETQWVRD